jgi:uncharacterized protein YxjI
MTRHAVHTGYLVPERLLTTHRSAVITDDTGDLRYRAERDGVSAHAQLAIRDPEGNERCTIALVEDADDRRVVTRAGVVLGRVERRMPTPVAPEFIVSTVISDLEVVGSALQHEYSIVGSDRPVVTVSKVGTRALGTYRVEPAAGEDHPLLIAVAIAVDTLARTR